MSEEFPALAASHRSWSAVQKSAKQEWLHLFADDAVIEDPIGRSPLDPEGKGHRGKEAIAAFWDTNIGPNTITIEMTSSFGAGLEAGHLGTITTKLPNGAVMKVDGIFTYKVNEEGKLLALRGFWSMSNLTVE